MGRLLLGLALIALPFVELALLVKTGQAIGLWPTLGLLVGAAVLGGAIMGRQGVSVARRAREAVALGRPPVGPVLDGVLLLLAGALLIMPGFVTDAMAVALMVPPSRRKLARLALRRLGERAHAAARKGAPFAADEANGPIIDGQFVRLDETSQPPHGGKNGEGSHCGPR